MTETTTLILDDERATQKLAVSLASILCDEAVTSGKIYLFGNLGAGKTTFSRYFIQGFGIDSPIKSPTYTLIEPYTIKGIANREEPSRGLASESNSDLTILHMDLYRLASPLELYDLGFLEEEDSFWLIEWPEKGEGVLPIADIELYLERIGESLEVKIKPKSELGLQIVHLLTTE